MKYKKHHTRSLLSVFQLMVSIALILCVVVIQKQIHYVKHRDLGFNKEQLLRIDLPYFAQVDDGQVNAFMQHLRQSPHIVNISRSVGVPGQISWFMGAGVEGKHESISIIIADSLFLKTFGLKILQGREVLHSEFGTVCYMNETAKKYYEWEDLQSKIYNNGRKGGYQVIGVVEDFHIASLYQKIHPLCILMDDQGIEHISVRLTAGPVGPVMGFIRKAWKEYIPNHPLEFEFYDTWFDSMYRKEERFASAIGIFALLAIGISCIGILGLAVLVSEQRTKEIGIRKVHGAKIDQILLLLNKDFLKWIAIAFFIASPLAYLVMHKWLEQFSYRTGISWWVFVLSGVSVLFLAFLTVSWQTLRAARTNPVEALRYE